MKSGRRGNLNESIGIASGFALAMTILVRLLRCARNDNLESPAVTTRTAIDNEGQR
jgi:hypothetical protein